MIFRWAILFLLLNEEAQQKCQEELDKIAETIPNLSDMDNLHYCQATILGLKKILHIYSYKTLFRGTQTWLYSSWHIGPQSNGKC